MSQKTAQVAIRITPEQKERIQAVCSHQGLTITAWILQHATLDAARLGIHVTATGNTP